MSDVKLYQDIQDGKNDHEGIMTHIGMVKKVEFPKEKEKEYNFSKEYVLLKRIEISILHLRFVKFHLVRV